MSVALRHVEQAGARVLAGRRVLERLDRLARLALELSGYDDVDRDQQVALGPVATCHTPALDPERAAVGGAGGQSQRHGGAGEGRHLDLSAEGGLREGHRDRQGEVVALAAEQPVRAHVHADEQVAGRAAALAACALALEPDALAVADPGRDAHREGAGAHRPSAAPAVGARVVDDESATPALAAGLGEGEPALVAAGLAAAVADRALPRHRTTPAAGAPAGRAGLLAGHPQRHRHAVDGVAEREGHLALHVGAAAGAGGAGTPTASEEAAEDVTEPARAPAAEHVAQVERVAPARPARAGRATPEAARPEQGAGLVVLPPTLVVGEHVVGLGDLLEPLLGRSVTPVGVGVELPGELAVGLLDLVRGGVLGDAERLVVVLLQEVLGAHAPPLPQLSGSATATRAGRTTRS